jgi:hypothetical protein
MRELWLAVRTRQGQKGGDQDARPDQCGERNVKAIEKRATFQRGASSDSDLHRERSDRSACKSTHAVDFAPSPHRCEQHMKQQEPNHQDGASVQHRESVDSREVEREAVAAQRP